MREGGLCVLVLGELPRVLRHPSPVATRRRPSCPFPAPHLRPSLAPTGRRAATPHTKPAARSTLAHTRAPHRHPKPPPRPPNGHAPRRCHTPATQPTPVGTVPTTRRAPTPATDLLLLRQDEDVGIFSGPVLLLVHGDILRRARDDVRNLGLRRLRCLRPANLRKRACRVNDSDLAWGQYKSNQSQRSGVP